MSKENLKNKALNEEDLDKITGGQIEMLKCHRCKRVIPVNMSDSNAKCPNCGNKIFS